MNWEREIEVLTPLFNRGAYQDIPEVRVPSIRGMVRWWFRSMGASPDDEKLIFGGMKNFGERTRGVVIASRLVFRVKDPPLPQCGFRAPTLPHKEGPSASLQAAFDQGVRFRLEVRSRLGALPPELGSKAENALEVWLLLGALGLRANRAGGNVWPAVDAPRSPEELRFRLERLGFRWPVMLVGREVGSSVKQLRAAATDTRKGMDSIFGSARGGQRLASPLKFKIARFGNDLRLLVFAPERRILDEARRALGGRKSRPETWELL